MDSIDMNRFGELADEAFDLLPEDLQQAMENVALFIDDTEDLELLGLYDGIPLTERGIDYTAVLPDRIMIYRNSICAICETEAEIVEQVRITVVHEVAHHFGIDDDALDELGWG